MKDNEILKETLLNYINLEYYANELDEEFQTLFKELEKRCTQAILSQTSINTKNVYSFIDKIVKEESEKFRKELEERLDFIAEEIMNRELDFLDKTYNKPIEKNNNVNWNKLILSGVTLSKILFAPIDNRDTTKDFVLRTQKNITNAYETSLRNGYVFGKNTNDICTDISNKLKQVSRGMQNGIRTAIPSYAKTTDKIVFLNNDIEVVWCSTLDGRTCLSCSALSGLHFKSIADAPAAPLHNLCRCVCLPVSAVNEPVPEFKDFIEMLDEEDQKKVLGVNRFNLWKDYNVSLNKFINNGSKIPWKQLKDKYLKH